MAITDEVLRLTRAARDRTVELNDQQVVAMTRAWVDTWSELEPAFNDAVSLLVADTEGTISASTVARNQRVTQAMQRARAQLDQLSAMSEVTITNDLASVVLDAADTHVSGLQAQLPPEAPGVLLGRLDDNALDSIVARSTQQIHSSRLPLAPDTEALMKSELVRGVVVGSNPNETARRIVQRTGDQFYGGLSRATRIARTESMDALRTADMASAQQNRDIITGWIWTSTLDATTCSACLGMHGTVHDVDAFGPEGHHQCRCTRIDKTKSWTELGFSGIEEPEVDLPGERDEWFANLTDDSQQRMLGPARYELLQNGDITWEDMAKRTTSDGWRDSITQTPVKDLANK